MCNPTMILTGLNVAQGAYGYETERRLAEATNEHQTRLRARNIELANRGAIRQYEDVLRRQQEEAAAAQASVADIMAATQAAMATARVEAAESGVAGQSVAALGRDFALQRGIALDRVDFNLEAVEQQTQSQLTAIRDNQEAQQLGLIAQPVPMPSLLGASLGIVGPTIRDTYLANKL